MTIRDIYGFLDEISPFGNQDKDDNSGLIVGDMDKQVKKVTVCLDITAELAENAGSDLIIAHHPPIYRPIKKIAERDPLVALIRKNIGAIGFHTNHDVARGGVSDIMIERLGFPESDKVIEAINADGSGYGRITELENAVTAKELAKMCKSAFDCAVVKYVDGKKPVKRIGLCSGGGSMLVEKARETGCEAYITGDIRWDRFVFAENIGLTLIDAGHFNTEDIFCDDLVGRLREKFPGLGVEKSEHSKDLCDYVT